MSLKFDLSTISYGNISHVIKFATASVNRCLFRLSNCLNLLEPADVDDVVDADNVDVDVDDIEASSFS